MTREERKNIIRVKLAITFACADLKRETKDLDCNWPEGIIKSLETCVKILDNFKV